MEKDKETLIAKLEKGRAEFAYNCVKTATERLAAKTQKEYRSYVRKIAGMIISNGLGQTLAFVFSKKKPGDAYDMIYNQLIDYFKSNNTTRINMPSAKNDLVDWVISVKSNDYRFITTECLAFLKWLKRFAEGMIETEEGS